ncbi:GPN-loop GTPase 3 isoform X2 [Musca domestica]|nr:GPN-loop GTPase 3 isoform X2 [Musca domestica]
MQRHAQDSKRVIEVVNLDPAAEHFDYQPLVDIRDLIQLDDAMDDEELHYGPNGGLVFCLEFLIENQDWLKNQLCGGGGGDDGDEVAEELGGEPDDDYILFDMPGQIELFTHLNMGKQLVQLLESWNFRICTVFLVDSQFMIDGAKFLSGTMAALSVMANLEMPHVNVLTKMDLLSKGAKKQLDKYLDPDARALLGDVTEESAWGRQHRKLSAAIGSLIEDFSLVRFVPMNVDDEESIQDLLLQIDNVIQYGEDADVKVHDFDPPEEEEGDEGTCRNIFDM